MLTVLYLAAWFCAACMVAAAAYIYGWPAALLVVGAVLFAVVACATDVALDTERQQTARSLNGDR